MDFLFDFFLYFGMLSFSLIVLAFSHAIYTQTKKVSVCRSTNARVSSTPASRITRENVVLPLYDYDLMPVPESFAKARELLENSSSRSIGIFTDDDSNHLALDTAAPFSLKVVAFNPACRGDRNFTIFLVPSSCELYIPGAECVFSIPDKMFNHIHIVHNSTTNLSIINSSSLKSIYWLIMTGKNAPVVGEED